MKNRKKTCIHLVILCCYSCVSIFLALFIVFSFMSWLSPASSNNWDDIKSYLNKNLFLSMKLGLMGIPLGIILWISYYYKK